MSKQISINQLFQGQSGRIGSYVLRIIDGQTYISIRPKKRTHSSDLQKKQMSRFQLAIKWANLHKHDPEFVLAAQQTKRNGINSYNLAIQKALNDPSILAEFTQTLSQPEPTTQPSISKAEPIITTTLSHSTNNPLPSNKYQLLKSFLISIIILITTTLTSYSQAPTTHPNPSLFFKRQQVAQLVAKNPPPLFSQKLTCYPLKFV